MCIVCVGLLSGQLSAQLCCLSVQPNFAHFIIFITVLHVCFYGLNLRVFMQSNSRKYKATCTWTLVGPPFQLNSDATSMVLLSTPLFRSRSIQISRAARSPSSTRGSRERRSFDSDSALLNVIAITRKSTTSGYVQGLSVTHGVPVGLLSNSLVDRGWHANTSGTCCNVAVLVILSVTTRL